MTSKGEASPGQGEACEILATAVMERHSTVAFNCSTSAEWCSSLKHALVTVLGKLFQVSPGIAVRLGRSVLWAWPEFRGA